MFLLFLTFVLAHLIADFVLQSEKMNALKKTQLHKGLRKHVFSHFIVMFVGILIFAAVSKQTSLTSIIAMMFVAVGISIIHYFIDWTKELLGKGYISNIVISSCLYIFDQILHVISIVAVLNISGLISYTFDQFIIDSLSFLFNEMVFLNPEKLLLLAIIIIIATQGTGYFLGIVLRNLAPTSTLNKGTYSIVDEKTEIKSLFNEKGEEINEVTTIKTEQFYKDSPKKIGHYIGIIERLLIVIFIVQGIPQGMAFLIAVKSLTRFKQFENKQFAEYYLIGSLFSALIGIILGYAVLRVI